MRPSELRLRIEPADPADNNEPAEPTDKIEPADPIDKIDPEEATDMIDPKDATDMIDPVDEIESIEKAEPADRMLRNDISPSSHQSGSRFSERPPQLSATCISINDAASA